MTENSNDLHFLSLGGAGEFGTNLNLYQYGGKWLMVDCGMGFGEGIRPGIEIILPNPKFIEQHKSEIVGLVITHAHEDHIGAVAQLWPRFRCPIYASPFAAYLLRGRLEEHNVRDAEVIEVLPGTKLDLDPFEVEFVPMTHSTLEPSLLAIRTPAGLVVHTGDWKLDPGPVLGALTDEARLKQLGDEGVLAVIGDSTNSLVAGHSRSESELQASFEEVFKRYHQKIAVTCFSSNVARMVTIARAAAACDRQTALIGRSLWRMEEAASESGYLDDAPDFLSENDIGYIPAEKLVLICTGSQAEPRSALSRIAEGDHQHAELHTGDAVIFSARAIPGNEKAIYNLQGRLEKRGIKVVTPDQEFVHVSGHPARDELVTMYQWLRPKALIPTHGEYPQMAEHARIAQECQIQHVHIPENGEIIRLNDGDLTVVDHVETGHIAVDGKRHLLLDAGSLRTRSKIAFEGAVVASLVLDKKGRVLADPQVSAPGLLAEDENRKVLGKLSGLIEDAIEKLPGEALKQDNAIKEAARLTLRRHFSNVYGKKPWIDIQVVRVE
jgi:ribonuclease J